MRILAGGYRLESIILPNGNTFVKCECGTTFSGLGERLYADIGEHVMEHMDEEEKNLPLVEEPEYLDDDLPVSPGEPAVDPERIYSHMQEEDGFGDRD